MKTGRLFFAVAILLFLSSPLSSWAHKVNIYAWVEGDRVFTESFFSDGKKAVHSQIEVFDSYGKRLLTGKTDREGLFSFKLNKREDLKIVLDASTGHRAEFNLPASEIAGGEDSAHSKAIRKEDSTAAVPCLSKEEIQSIVEKVLDEKLRPIQRKLAESEKRRPGVTEILGGIGYIIGLIGVAVYLSHRKKARSKP